MCRGKPSRRLKHTDLSKHVGTRRCLPGASERVRERASKQATAGVARRIEIKSAQRVFFPPLSQKRRKKGPQTYLRRVNAAAPTAAATCERTSRFALLALSRTRAAVTSLLLRLRLGAPARLRHLLTSFFPPPLNRSGKTPLQCLVGARKTSQKRDTHTLSHTRTPTSVSLRLMNGSAGWCASLVLLLRVKVRLTCLHLPPGGAIKASRGECPARDTRASCGPEGARLANCAHNVKALVLIQASLLKFKNDGTKDAEMDECK